ncbi:MAG TPA: HD domain-containing phosphohydrolase [Thermomicrobiales bacterium]|jgi:HD-GYP domain-containing protein (c-di-GMP phosphodiesterase class II)
MTAGNTTRVRLAELVASLSLATDLGMGQPLEQALRTCLLAVTAGRELGLENRVLSDVYYLALLRFVGCTSDAHEQAALVGGDEIAYYAGVAPIVMAGTSEYLAFLARRFAADAPPLTRMRIVGRMLASGVGAAKESIAVHCEVARMLAARLGLPESVGAGVGHVFERWDGKGLPGELAGEAIPVHARVVATARDVDLFHRLGGWDAVAEVLRHRRAKAYDPAVVGVFLDRGERWLADAASAPVWEVTLAAEPSPWVRVGDVRLDRVLDAFAAFADLKSPFTRGHSTGVAALAEGAARHAGLGEPGVTDLRRAALVHDLGRTGIPNGIWDKPGPLTRAEWERVRLHPYLTERILFQASALAPLAALAGAHHERLDGSGYHRGSPAALIPPAARILAAADAYQAMTQERPHRPALSPEAAARQLSAEADVGRLDGDAVRCVLAAAGHGLRRRRWPSGLSEREVEVLRHIARGATFKEVAGRLSISPKTAEHHVQHIYAKIGVSSRAAAALFAMEHNLLVE